MRNTLLLLAVLLASTGCPPGLGDDDDATANDDDATANDDDATMDDDDATMDDDDATMSDDDDSGDDDDSSGPTCETQLEASLQTFATWSGVSACGDAFLSIGDQPSTARVAISVNTSGLSLAPGQVWTLDVAGLTVPPNTLNGSAYAQRGSYLQSQDCVGVPPIDTPVIDRSFGGTAGFVTFTILTADRSGGFTADVSISGLQVTADDDASVVCPVPDRELDGLGFGYWPA